MKSYVGKDIVALRRSIIDTIQRETSDWTDFNEGDLGMVLVETLAGIADMLNFYLDKQANEVYLDRAKEPKNIRSILQTINYRIPLKVAPYGELRVVVEDTWAFDIIIPRYTRFCTSSDSIVEYVSTKDEILSAGEREVFISVKQGKRIDKYVKVEKLKKEWKYYLDSNNVAEKSVIIIDSIGEWEEVDDAFLEYKGGRYFSIHRDPEEKVYILFTWNWDVLLPDDPEEEVHIMYLDTMGEEGRVESYAIDTVLDNVYDENGEDIKRALVVRNTESARGGVSEYDLYEETVKAKRFVKRMGKLVTLEDYRTRAMDFPEVYRAVAQDWSSEGSIVAKPYQVMIWVVPHKAEELPLSYCSKMKSEIYGEGICIIDLIVQQATYIDFTIKARIKIKSSDEAYRRKLRLNVQEALYEEYSHQSLSFGYRIIKSEIEATIYRVSPHITEAVVDTPEGDIRIQSYEYPRLLNVELEVEGTDYGI